MSENNFIILSEKDIPDMREIIEHGEEIAFDEQHLRDFLKLDGVHAFGWLQDGKIVGFIYGYDLLHPDGTISFFNYSVGLLPEYQNKGIGTKFIQAFTDWCRESGRYTETFVPTDKGNPRACRVYEKAGGINDYEDEIIYVTKFKK